jgi:hypothetical protein
MTSTARDERADTGKATPTRVQPKTIVKIRGDAWAAIAVAATALIAGALYAWSQGEDANWDWQNYHEYNVWAVLNGRYETDVAPAGFQTYFNPLVYFPAYYLRHLLPAPYGSLIIGAFHGLTLLPVYYLTRAVLREATTPSALLASMLIAACGAMTLSEVGTSFSDITTALPVVAGFAVILSADETHRTRYLLAGLFLGVAVGLKLTNVVFGVGAAASLLLSARPLLAIPYLAIGGAIGATATGGTWSMMLWRELGNPVFPLFNGIFSSREVQPVNILDLQFLPRSIPDALAYPFYWLLGDNRTAEHPFRDARFAIVTVLSLASFCARLLNRGTVFTRRDCQVFVLFIVSYFVWLGLFAIHRYAVVLELLCGPLIVLLLTRITASFKGTAYGEMSGQAGICLSVAIALWCQPADWWHRPWSMPYRPKFDERLQQPATYFLLDKPLGYVAPLLAPGARFYQIADIALPILPDGKFDRRIRAHFDDPLPGGIWELHVSGNDKVRYELLDGYGLVLDRSKPCTDIEGIVPSTAVVACPLRAKRPSEP